MSRRSQKKIPTDGADAPLGSAPFAALDDLADSIASANEPRKPNRQNAELKPKGTQAVKPRSKGRVEIRREKAGRGGKTVTTLQGLPSHIPLKTLDAMLMDLKKECACGGTLRGRTLELQGDVCDKICQILDRRGYHSVRAGG